MLTQTIQMEWLWDLAREYRNFVKNSDFFKSVSLASSPEDFQWIRQLYHLCCDFTAATALRYGNCDDPRFRDVFAKHAAEEVEHPKQLAIWMRKFGLLAKDENPNSVPPTLETLALGSYFIRSVTREPIAHQIITLNLMGEGLAVDFFNTVNPELTRVGLTPEGYWLVHQEADVGHQILGLDLIPQCEKNTTKGREYSRTIWEISSLWRQVFDSWSVISMRQKVQIPTPAELNLN